MFDLPFELPESWELKTVQQLIDEDVIDKPLDGNHGGIHPKSSDYVESGVPFVMASDLDNGRVGFDSCKFITEEQASTLRKGFSKVGDVLLSHKATIGRTAIVQENKHDFIMLTPQVTYYRVKDETQLNNVYLKAYFDSSFFQNILGLWAGAGSTRAYLGITGQLKLPVIIPPLEKQLSIAGHVGSINEKIELNRQTNQTLEHIAQAVFKSWFVDFEPTRAKIAAKQVGRARQDGERSAALREALLSDGRWPEAIAGAIAEGDPERAAMAAISGKSLDELDQLSQEQKEQLKTTAALFPDAIVNSELGEIPEGWEVGTLSSVADIIMGHSPKGDTYNDKGIGTPLVNGPVEFGSYHTKKIKWTTAPTRMSKDRDLIVCVRGSTTGRFVKSDGDYCLGRGVCAIRSQGNQPYVDYLFKSEILKLLGMTTGSTFPSWSGPVLKDHEIVRSDSDVIAAYTLMIENIELKISSAEVEIEQLVSLRDSLLPKLLSGELTI